MVAMNLALGYSAEDIDRVASATDMEKTVQDANLCCGAMQLLDLCWCCCSKGRLGIFPGNRLLKFIGDTIAERTGNPLTTFKELYDETGVELCIMVCNLTCMTTEEWHVKTTPNTPIRDAVRGSATICKQPLYVDRRSPSGAKRAGCSYGLNNLFGLLIWLDQSVRRCERRWVCRWACSRS